MSVRFEVIRNGERLCTAGITGDGVLGVDIGYINRESDEHPPDYRLHVGGLGYYHPSDGKKHHVRWRTPSQLNVGDEIIVRILPPGEFDDPIQMIASPSATVDDPIFGRLVYNVEAWDGEVAFPHAPFTHAHVHVLASETGPTDKQRHVFEELKSRYDQWWPRVAQAVCKCHPDLSTVDELERQVCQRLSVDLLDPPASINLTLDFGDEWEDGYSVRLRDWEVIAIWGDE
ncbi:MAG: hypothetical protein AAGG48_32060 [Planctomycetota bacterium]